MWSALAWRHVHHSQLKQSAVVNPHIFWFLEPWLGAPRHCPPRADHLRPITRCTLTPCTYITSCLFWYFCDSDIVYLFIGQAEWVSGYPPTVSTYLLWWPELQDGEPDSFVTFGRCSFASSAKVYPPFGVSSSVPVQGGGSVRSLFCFLSLIGCER